MEENLVGLVNWFNRVRLRVLKPRVIYIMYKNCSHFTSCLLRDIKKLKYGNSGRIFFRVTLLTATLTQNCNDEER